MIHKGTVMLETERLILRRFTIDDLEQMFRNCWSDIEVWKWTSYKPMQSIEDVINIAEMFTEKWLGAYDRPNRYSWAIQLKASGEVIGRFFGMNPDDEISQIELAYELGREWWNQGYMTEAVKAIIDFFFKEVGLNRIYANFASKNPASGKVMQKCGMTYEGTMRQALKCNNGLFDKVNYAILADEYFK
ncbi:MAG: GNAT family N-acetyltransferase [Mobilitalea sp.]